jgi:glycosyltransferase involved in cell wall biosynthesis
MLLLDGRSIGRAMTGMDRCVTQLTIALLKIYGRDQVRLALRAEGLGLVRAAGIPDAVLELVPHGLLSGQGVFLMRQVANKVGASVYQHFFIPAPYLRTTPLVSMIFDTNHALLPGYYERWDLAQRLVGRAMFSWTTRRAQVVAVNSNFVKQQVKKNFGARSDIRVVPLGADHVAANRLVRSPEYFLCLGQDRPHKNLGRLLRAYSLYRQKGGQKPLVLAGNFSTRHGRVTQRLGQIPVDGVRVRSYVADADLDDLYRHSAALVVPSIAEGFGLPILEAMMRGVPVICSNTSALPEVAGDAARYVDPTRVDSIADALEEMDRDWAAGDRLIRRGFDRAHMFKWADTAASMAAIYDGIPSARLATA